MNNPDAPLLALAAQIERLGLRTPTLMMLELLSPLDLLSTQFASFGSIFVRGTQAEMVLERLTEAEAWAALRRQLAQLD